MATVFLAHDISLDRKVAIKVMSPILASDDRMVERFRREAKTVAGLKHPNIGTVHRVLEGEGLYFFVMDFIRGRSLDAIIHRNGVLSIVVTRALLHQIGSGLAHAHRRKIYHRDVKPANVLVSAADGTAVVTDFGIAKVAESPTQTQTGAVVGTPAYMAPEQIYGREITGAVDQYALGIMAFEMLTGAPPFVGTSYVVMHAHMEIQPRSVRESRPDCPPELDEAIARMLAKDPAHRWPSLPHALAAMGANMTGEDDPIRAELIRLATPDEAEEARYATNTPLSPPPPSVPRGANVAMVAISPPPELIEVGDSFRLAASARDVRGDEIPGITIEWATNNPSVLSVQSDGSVSALAAGMAEISATATRARGAMLLTVEPGRVAGLQLSIPPGALMAGDRIQLAARVLDKHRRSLGYTVQWGVGDPNIARVTPEGVLEARAPGSVEVFAESKGVRSVARVQIAPPAVAAVQLMFDPQRPVVGDRIRVTATPVDAHGRPLRDRPLGWSLSDLTLVKIVSDGVYEAWAEGTLRVTAASEQKSATIEIPIAAAPVATIRVSPPPERVVAGSTFKLVAVAFDAKGNTLLNRRIDWICSNANVATIDADGTVIARSAGNVKIVASCEGKMTSIAVSIEPSAPQVVAVPAPEPAAPAPVSADYSTTAFFDSHPPLVATPAPAAVSPTPAPASRGRSRLLVSAGALAVVAVVTSIAISNRSRTSPRGAVRDSVVPSTARDSVVLSTARDSVVTPTPPQIKAEPQPVSAQVDRTLQVTKPPPRVPTTTITKPVASEPTTTTKPVAVERERDAFRINLSAQAPMRVGETTTLHANVERTAGRGATPRVEWESSRPAVLRVDPLTGVAVALAEGQATVSAIAGGTRGEVSVIVLPVAVSAAAAPEPAPVRETRPAPPPAEEGRARGAEALRESAHGMVAALNAKRVPLVRQLLVDEPNADATELLRTVRDGYGFTASMEKVNPPQMTERSGTLEYQVKVTWVSAAGPTRTRTVTLRAETSRTADGWSAVHHRVVSWR